MGASVCRTSSEITGGGPASAASAGLRLRQRRRPPAGRSAQPASPASATTTGNGTPNSASARKASDRDGDQGAGCAAPAWPTRTTAWTTIASTAGASPANSAATAVVVAERDVDRRQRQQRDDAGQHEQAAGDQPAAGAVQQPADVGGQLLRLGAGQQHAVVHRVQEPALADPPLLVDERPLHDGDLAGRAAEGLQRDGEPGAHRRPEGDQRRAASSPAAASLVTVDSAVRPARGRAGCGGGGTRRARRRAGRRPRGCCSSVPVIDSPRSRTSRPGASGASKRSSSRSATCTISAIRHSTGSVSS